VAGVGNCSPLVAEWLVDATAADGLAGGLEYVQQTHPGTSFCRAAGGAERLAIADGFHRDFQRQQ